MRGPRPPAHSAPRHRLGFGAGFDPRLAQLGFALAFLFAMGLLVLGGSTLTPSSLLGAATALCLAITAVTLVLPWRLLPRRVSVLVPILDIAAIGLGALDSSGWACAPLLVGPAVWLSGQFRRPGALGAGMAALLFFAIPSTAYLGTGGGTLAWSVLVPLAVTALGLALVQGMDRLEADRSELSRQRRALEEAGSTIAQQRRFGDALLDTVDVGLAMLDHTGRIQTTNKQHEDFMALIYPRGRDAGLVCAYAVDGSTALEPERLPERRAIRGEDVDDCLIWVGEDPMGRRALSVSARSVRDDAGTVVGATLAYKDVTDFMRALLVKDEFVASVSHELRTPLTSIRGYLDLVLEQDDVGESSRRFLEVAERNGERLQRLVADLLHTLQTDAGSMDVVRELADLATVVRDSVHAALPEAHAAGLDLTVDAPEELWAVVDGQRMTQVVDNLISNAVKYTQQGSVRVTLAVEDRLVLTVSDTGIGIDAMDREHLFTRFFRARHAQDQSIQGVGLGLSIIRSIVESHGGRIEVDSEIGHGSRFQVRLPLDLLRSPVRPPEVPEPRDGQLMGLREKPTEGQLR